MLLDSVSGYEFRAPNQVRRDHEIRGLTGEVWEVLHFYTRSSFRPAQHQQSGIESRSVFTTHMAPSSRVQHLPCFAHELTLISLLSHFITKKLSRLQNTADTRTKTSHMDQSFYAQRDQKILLSLLSTSPPNSNHPYHQSIHSSLNHPLYQPPIQPLKLIQTFFNLIQMSYKAQSLIIWTPAVDLNGEVQYAVYDWSGVYIDSSLFGTWRGRRPTPTICRLYATRLAIMSVRLHTRYCHAKQKTQSPHSTRYNNERS